MPYAQFDRSRLIVRPLAEREHDLDLSAIMELDADVPDYAHPGLDTLAARIVDARKRNGEILLMMGAHVIRRGNSRFIIDLLRRGIITHIGANGACAIHDFEFALIGATTESVARYIRTGEFGLWQETGWINDAVKEGAQAGLGFGESVGRMIVERDFPHRDVSIFAAAYELGIPVTVHVGIGSDIIHEHPNFDGALTGLSSYRDFLTVTDTITRLEGGVMLNFGTAVMGPEVYLKALSMARNVARQEGREIAHFTTAVFDLMDLGENVGVGPEKSDPHYYYRPWKTVLVRTVQDGGESFYFKGDHRVTFPSLYRRVVANLEGQG
ncbi:MAG: hypothetical protein KBI47_06060 [Armatimonadetes bacterium]|jgi:hypothetical protein|nr:hypothetical protein [Armatimonadota bacterium]MDI9586064.1 hypothetical protein [Acidobacteriota bacterium]